MSNCIKKYIEFFHYSCKLWLYQCKNQKIINEYNNLGFNKIKNYTICSDHFEKEDFNNQTNEKR